MKPAQTTRKILFWLGLSLPTAALLVMAWLVQQSSGKFNNSFAWVNQSYQVLDLLERAQGDILDAEANQRGFLLTGDKKYLAPYHAALDQVQQDMNQLKPLTDGNAAQQSNLTLLQKLIADDLVFDPARAFASNQPPGGAAVAAVNDRGIQKLDRLRRLLVQTHQDQQQALSRRQQEAEDSVASARRTSLVLIATVALALILVVVIQMRFEKLQRIVTVCAWTGQVKHEGQWLKLDDYLQRQFGLTVSHSLSREAAEKMRQEVEGLKRQNPPPEA